MLAVRLAPWMGFGHRGKGSSMRSSRQRGVDPGDEFGRQDVLSWAEDRPLVAVFLVLLAWIVVVFAIGTLYAMVV
jgi:hypothetical protein